MKIGKAQIDFQDILWLRRSATKAGAVQVPRDVAEKLILSSRTVGWHLGSIYRKLEAHSRTEATRFAVEHGLL